MKNNDAKKWEISLKKMRKALDIREGFSYNSRPQTERPRVESFGTLFEIIEN